MGSGLCLPCLSDARTALVLQAPQGSQSFPESVLGLDGDREVTGPIQDSSRGWRDWEKSPLSSVAATDHEMERRPSKEDPETQNWAQILAVSSLS